MTIPRRAFARSVIAALAGATVLRQAVAAPVKEQLAEAVPPPIVGPELAIAWKTYHIGARRITVMCSVSRELLEDSPFGIRLFVEGRLAAAMAKKIDEEWGKGVKYTVAKSCDDDPAKQIVSYAHVATEDKSHVLRRAEWLSRRALGKWDGTPTLLQPDSTMRLTTIRHPARLHATV